MWSLWSRLILMTQTSERDGAQSGEFAGMTRGQHWRALQRESKGRRALHFTDDKVFVTLTTREVVLE